MLLRARGSAGMALSTLDMGIIVAYLVFAVGLGVYFSRTNKTTEAFFLGSRGLPGWALGLSLLSTSISSNTFLAIPSYSYASDFGLLLKDRTYLTLKFLVATTTGILLFTFRGRLDTLGFRRRVEFVHQDVVATERVGILRHQFYVIFE